MPLEYHEPREQLPPEVIEQHRAVASLIEELEAAVWYHQRAAVSTEPDLKAVMEHNRNEEIEHAVMLMEWLRRNFPGFEEEMQTYLFKTQPITQIEEDAEAGEDASDQPASPGDAKTGNQSLNIGSMKKGE